MRGEFALMRCRATVVKSDVRVKITTEIIQFIKVVSLRIHIYICYLLESIDLDRLSSTLGKIALPRRLYKRGRLKSLT